MDRAGLKPGFSLVELMVTVALVAFILGIGVTYLNGPQYRLKAAAFSLRSAFQRTEFAAIKRNRNVYLDFNFNNAGVGNDKLTVWVDNDRSASFNTGDVTLRSVAQAPHIAYGTVPNSQGGPAGPPANGTPLNQAVSFGSGNATRALFRADGTSDPGTVYLYIADDPGAGTYAVVLNTIGHAATWYFKTGGTSWQER